MISDHSANMLTVRLLLHHFLSDEDLQWLTTFDFFMIDSQKRAIIFARETGAIDNNTYRQINGCDVLKASAELRALRDAEILDQKGKGRNTYYVPGYKFSEFRQRHSKLANTQGLKGLTQQDRELTQEANKLTKEGTSANQQGEMGVKAALELSEDREFKLPDKLQDLVIILGKRSNDKQEVLNLIVQLCAWKPLRLSELASILNRNANHLFTTYISPLREAGKIHYTHPEMPTHPEQRLYSSVK